MRHRRYRLVGIVSFLRAGRGCDHDIVEGSWVSETDIKSQVAFYRGVNGIIQNLGAFCGMLAFAYFAQWTGRRPAFIVAFIGAFVSTIMFFKMFDSMDKMWISFVMGFFQLALFAGFAIYLPELFPTRLRSTGTSFCYNVGRFVAATGPFTLGELQKWLSARAIADIPIPKNRSSRGQARRVPRGLHLDELHLYYRNRGSVLHPRNQRQTIAGRLIALKRQACDLAVSKKEIEPH